MSIRVQDQVKGIWIVVKGRVIGVWVEVKVSKPRPISQYHVQLPQIARP